jgi:hypothetical protein
LFLIINFLFKDGTISEFYSKNVPLFAKKVEILITFEFESIFLQFNLKHLTF